MKLSEISFDGPTPIDAYGPGFFRVGGEVVDGGIVLCGHNILPWTGYADLSFLAPLARDIDVLLVGTGAEPAFPPPAFRDAVEAAGIGVEPMITPSACRTYNILLSEGRRVAVCLTAL